jgi:hypothetical protein
MRARHCSWQTTHGGPITDTIWMLHDPQTVFEALDEAIELLAETPA